MADFGCGTKIPSDALQEHYSTKIHQEYLMKAIEFYNQQLLNGSKNNSTLSSDEENYSEIADSLAILTDGLSCLHDDNVQLHDSHVKIQSHLLDQHKQIVQLKSSIEESVQLVQASQINNNILQTEIETMKQKMMDLWGQ
jgi:small-conductance mechanosensitive channel